jgi:ribonuclease HII
VAVASPAEIDAINILQATMLAMRRAVLGLLGPASGATPYGSVRVEVDGNRLPALEGVAGIAEAVAIVKGDATQPAISAASILAKTARDHVMEHMDSRSTRVIRRRPTSRPSRPMGRVQSTDGVSDR